MLTDILDVAAERVSTKIYPDHTSSFVFERYRKLHHLTHIRVWHGSVESHNETSLFWRIWLHFVEYSLEVRPSSHVFRHPWTSAELEIGALRKAILRARFEEMRKNGLSDGF
jgi:hypothetical protein